MALTFTHPEDVLQSRVLSVADMRDILANWTSDAHTVPNRPSMRQLDSDAIVSIDAVLAALRELVGRELVAAPSRHKQDRRAKRKTSLLSRWRTSSSRNGDNDDDPRRVRQLPFLPASNWSCYAGATSRGGLRQPDVHTQINAAEPEHLWRTSWMPVLRKLEVVAGTG